MKNPNIFYPPKPPEHNLYDYWQWPGVFDKKDLEKMHEIFNKTHIKDAEDSPAKGKSKIVNLKMSPWINFKQILSPLEQLFLKTQQDNFGYHIYPQYDYNYLMLNEYDGKQKGEYDWHTDGSGNYIQDVKFTLLINASLEPYEGGEFVYFRAGERHIKELNTPGNIIFFKSYLSHKVYPVTKGKRHTITLFYLGPRFV